MLVLASDVFASVLRAVGEEPGFPEQATTSAEESKNRAKKKFHGIDHAGGGIAFRLWTATSHPAEIKGGQNFGERQG